MIEQIREQARQEMLIELQNVMATCESDIELYGAVMEWIRTRH